MRKEIYDGREAGVYERSSFRDIMKHIGAVVSSSSEAGEDVDEHYTHPNGTRIRYLTYFAAGCASCWTHVTLNGEEEKIGEVERIIRCEEQIFKSFIQKLREPRESDLRRISATP